MKTKSFNKLSFKKATVSNLGKVNGGIQAESDDPKSQSLCQSDPDCKLE